LSDGFGENWHAFHMDKPDHIKNLPKLLEILREPGQWARLIKRILYQSSPHAIGLLSPMAVLGDTIPASIKK
jgi:hypothetical protein